ncbi:MAG TPA: hypothetical protein VLZ54_09185 [Arenibacter sp.]|nr:hypothetical protein [Arenibacter sp.]
MIATKSHITVSLGYFLMAALLGVLLRTFVVLPIIPLNYRFIVHTHSHIALLGWVYMALTTVLYHLFLSGQEVGKKYKWIFWTTQLSLVGMLLSFPFQGYALFSIAFSTLFLLASYWFAAFFMKNVSAHFKGTYAYKCIRIALWFMIGSSIGPWAMGPIMTLMGPESIWYRLAIYFYLHFLYNGWMILALAGLFFHVLERWQIVVPQRKFNTFFQFTVGGIVLSVFLSLLWTKPMAIFYVLGGIGALLQIIGFFILFGICFDNRSLLKKALPIQRYGMLLLIASLLMVKIALQFLSAFPYFADLAATALDFTIGYLHWTFLGVITIGIFFFLDYFGLIKLTKQGFIIYLMGFLFTESFIFYKGLAAWQRWSLFDGYLKYLAFFSLLIPLALLLILWDSKGKRIKRQ